jgi:hypothetical protein
MAPDETSAKRIAEYTSAIAAILAVVVASLYVGGVRPLGGDLPIGILVAAAVAMTFSFAGGVQATGEYLQRRRVRRLIRENSAMVDQLRFLAREVYEATTTGQAFVSSFGYNASSVQQCMVSSDLEKSRKVGEQAAFIINEWAASDGLRKTTMENALARCDSDAGESNVAFCQTLDEVRELAVAGTATVQAFLYCVRQGFPCEKVTQHQFDQWASFAGRMNQYQVQLSYLIRDANAIFGTEMSPWLGPVPPWLWLKLN